MYYLLHLELSDKCKQMVKSLNPAKNSKLKQTGNTKVCICRVEENPTVAQEAGIVSPRHRHQPIFHDDHVQ